jgi:hypothetical protein
MLMFFKVIGAIITLYLVIMLVKELIKIAKERDKYDDKIDLP